LLTKVSFATIADLSEPKLSSRYKEQIQFLAKHLNQFCQDYQELIQLSIKLNGQWKNNTKLKEKGQEQQNTVNYTGLPFLKGYVQSPLPLKQRKFH